MRAPATAIGVITWFLTAAGSASAADLPERWGGACRVGDLPVATFFAGDVHRMRDGTVWSNLTPVPEEPHEFSMVAEGRSMTWRTPELVEVRPHIPKRDGDFWLVEGPGYGGRNNDAATTQWIFCTLAPLPDREQRIQQ